MKRAHDKNYLESIIPQKYIIETPKTTLKPSHSIVRK